MPQKYPLLVKNNQVKFHYLLRATLADVGANVLTSRALAVVCRACYPTTEEEVEAFLCMVLMQNPHGRHAQGTADGLVGSDSAGKALHLGRPCSHIPLNHVGSWESTQTDESPEISPRFRRTPRDDRPHQRNLINEKRKQAISAGDSLLAFHLWRALI